MKVLLSAEESLFREFTRLAVLLDLLLSGDLLLTIFTDVVIGSKVRDDWSAAQEDDDDDDDEDDDEDALCSTSVTVAKF